MKKLFIILLSAVVLMIFTGCRTKEEAVSENVIVPDFSKEELDEKFGTDDIYIVKTYMETPANEFQEYLDNNLIFTKVKHYQLSDGSWKTDEHDYTSSKSQAL